MRKSLAQAIEDRVEAFVSEPICVLRNAERRLIELGGGDGEKDPLVLGPPLTPPRFVELLVPTASTCGKANEVDKLS
jgi:hypothetical protein